MKIFKKKIFELLNKGYKNIPIYIKIFLNKIDSFNIYIKLLKLFKKKKKNTFIVEFNINNVKKKYSILNINNIKKISIYNKKIFFYNKKKINIIKNINILEYINNLFSKKNYFLNKNIKFTGGVLGYFNYDFINYIEKKNNIKNKFINYLNLPNIYFFIVEEFLYFNYKLNYIYIFYLLNNIKKYNIKINKINKIIYIFKKNVNFLIKKKNINNNKIIRLFKKKKYLKTILKAKNNIENGNLMQIQISQCFKTKYNGLDLLFYKILKNINPSPYLYFLHFNEFKIIGSSPETFIKHIVKKKNLKQKIIIRPIAGTRPRGKNNYEDIKIFNELINDPKEIAEHIMLIDLARNDISKIIVNGTLKLTKKMIIEKYSHVQHIVSNIKGMLKYNYNNIDILKATFPAGTLTGTPKIKSIEIINKLEPIKRSIYGGACGYISYNNNMDLAIIIRTAIIKNNILYTQAAGGIVYDSKPIKE